MSLDLDAHTRIADLPDDPLELLTAWLGRAEEAEEIRYPGAMCLSTVSPEGRPEGRFVIVHLIAGRDLVFLTDARSPKARSLASSPAAALTAYWGPPLELQVRVEGEVEPAPEDVADEIFARRPRRSQATPWISRQSEPTTLEELARALERAERGWEGGESLPRPEHWRAYRLTPRRFEFWQARRGRLHDRALYTPGEKGWTRVRLAP